MKFLKYLLPIIAILISACTGGDGDNRLMRWTGQSDVSDYTMYAGSPEGAVVVPIQSDSEKRTNVQRYLGQIYDANLYSGLSVEFIDNMMTYTDSTYVTKIVSTYDFQNDSLFANLSDGKQRFIAQGTQEELYRVESIIRYRNKDGRDTVQLIRKGLVGLDLVLDSAGYASKENMTDKTDTIMWCNVKYVFKK